MDLSEKCKIIVFKNERLKINRTNFWLFLNCSFYRMNNFFKQIFKRNYLFFTGRTIILKNAFTEQIILFNDRSVKNGRNRWKMNDNFEGEQNLFFYKRLKQNKKDRNGSVTKDKQTKWKKWNVSVSKYPHHHFIHKHINSLFLIFLTETISRNNNCPKTFFKTWIFANYLFSISWSEFVSLMSIWQTKSFSFKKTFLFVYFLVVFNNFFYRFWWLLHR